MADNIPGSLVSMNDEEIKFLASQSQQVMTKIGANINALLAFTQSASIEVFESSGTWTKPAGLRSVFVIATGPGGNGGGITFSGAGTASGGGGGSGATVMGFLDAGDLGSTETVTISSPGSATTFGTHIVANHGNNGQSASGSFRGIGGQGGSATGGEINSSGGGGSGGGIQVGGYGASSIWGGGGGGGNTGSSPANGSAGSSWGCGGGGAVKHSASGTATGGSGSTGVVIVLNFF